MTHATEFGALALGAVLLCGNVGLAGDIATDVNIVTGLDVSYSIAPDDLRLEIEGFLLTAAGQFRIHTGFPESITPGTVARFVKAGNR
jgi:hypothetical protein